MKKLLSLLAFIALCSLSFAQLNMSQVGLLTYQENLSDVWGYADETGVEYGLVGIYDGFSVVSLLDPSNPVELFFEPGDNSIWRDIKTWDDHAYVTTEGGGGLLIVDLSPLPGSSALPFTYYTGTNYNWTTAHNLYIDENGICYIFGANYANGGAIMLDLTQDPMNPVEVGLYDDYYVHDGVARGDTLYVSCISDGFTGILDVTDKMNPITLATWNTPHFFSHNNWISDDGKHIFTTDEVSDAYVAAYNIEDVNNVYETDRFQTHLSQDVIPHNTHWIDGYLVTSYYHDGISVLDVSDPGNMVEVGYFDTSPSFTGSGYSGCWGAYPWLPSGLILASDEEEGLYVLQPTYVRGCYLDGTVTEASTGTLLNNVNISIDNTWVNESSNLNGTYAAGYATAGTYSVTYSKPGYSPYTETGVSLTNGTITTVDVQLTALSSFTMSGTVVSKTNGNPINGANVLIYNDDFQFETWTSVSGAFTIPNFFAGDYTIVSGSWGYFTECSFGESLSSSGISITLSPGYMDDFTFDFGWAVSGDAADGTWERGEPEGTDYNGNWSNPDEDVSDDCTGLAYVTGNAGGGAGNDDVDDGYTQLTSPVFDGTLFSTPHLSLYTWFYNSGGGTTPNDYYRGYVCNGTDTAQLFNQAQGSPMSIWVNNDYDLSSLITPTSSMYIFVKSADNSPGHLVEAGLDLFMVYDGNNPPPPLEIRQNLEFNPKFSFYPNPATDQLNFNSNFSFQYQIIDPAGRTVLANNKSDLHTGLNLSHLSQGYYLMNILSDDQAYKKTYPLIIR